MKVNKKNDVAWDRTRDVALAKRMLYRCAISLYYFLMWFCSIFNTNHSNKLKTRYQRSKTQHLVKKNYIYLYEK